MSDLKDLKELTRAKEIQDRQEMQDKIICRLSSIREME